MNNDDKKLWTFHQTDNAKNLMQGYPRQDILSKKVEKYAKNGNVLEIGFGDGYLLKKLSKRYKCYGADISTANIEQIKKIIADVKFDVIGIDGVLPYPDSFFDVFVASEVLEHMSNEELQRSIIEIKRILKPNGFAIMTVPAEEDLKKNECFCPKCGEIFHKWGHKQFWDEKKIRSLFSNFNVLKVKKCYFSNPGLNISGKIGFMIKKIIVEFFNFQIDGATFFISVKKQ